MVRERERERERGRSAQERQNGEYYQKEEQRES